MEYKKIELLAPAGSSVHLRAAVNSGADAVYLGGKLFNARAGAQNFDNYEMEKAVEYCHERGVRLYVTMNTLLFDYEMEEALNYAEYLYRIGADAIIVQDLGLLAAAGRALPGLPLHLSTQGTVYSREGVLAAAQLGVSRVVLARETNIEEIREISSSCHMELEAFIHGALCFCYSGQCRMSAARGGRSGNRGMCAQPCRLPYTISGKSSEREKGYILSPRDLCTVDFLGELISAGISSFKIEGRVKSPEYVAVVTSIYRKYIDMYEERGFYGVSPEDRRALLQIFNRGGFTEGYYFGNPGRKLMSGDIPKHEGIRIGRVIKPMEKHILEIELLAEEKLEMGDGIEIRNPEMPGNVVTYIKPLNNEKNRLLIGDIKGNVRSGDWVYKITDKALRERAALSYFVDKDGKEKNPRRTGVKMTFTAKEGERATLSLNQGEIYMTVLSENIVPKAENKPLTVERVREQLNKTGDTVFYAETIEVELEGEPAMSASSLNFMRRKALELFSEKKKRGEERKGARQTEEKWIPYFDEPQENEKVRRINIYLHKWTAESMEEIRQVIGEKKGSYRLLLPVVMYFGTAENCETVRKRLSKIDGGEDVEIMPYISNVSKGAEDIYIRENFEKIVEECKDKGIFAGNIGWLAALAQAGAVVHAGYGLNSANKFSESLLRSMGAGEIMPALEFADAAMDKDSRLQGAGDRELSIKGAVPLMVTEHIMPEGFIKDIKGKGCLSMINTAGDKTLILEEGGYKTLFTICSR